MNSDQSQVRRNQSEVQAQVNDEISLRIWEKEQEHVRTRWTVTTLDYDASRKISFICLNGKSASGKDTQAKLLLERIPNSMRISTGDIYREAIAYSDVHRKFYSKIAPYIKPIGEGIAIPDPIVLEIVQDVLQEGLNNGKRTFIFTGFPRTITHLETLDNWIAHPSEGCTAAAHHIYYAVLDEHTRRRTLTRLEEGKQEMNFRLDDTIQFANGRLERFKRVTIPMLKQLLTEGRLHIIRSNISVNEVFVRTGAVLGLNS